MTKSTSVIALLGTLLYSSAAIAQTTPSPTPAPPASSTTTSTTTVQAAPIDARGMLATDVMKAPVRNQQNEQLQNQSASAKWPVRGAPGRGPPHVIAPAMVATSKPLPGQEGSRVAYRTVRLTSTTAYPIPGPPSRARGRRTAAAKTRVGSRTRSPPKSGPGDCTTTRTSARLGRSDDHRRTSDARGRWRTNSRTTGRFPKEMPRTVPGRSGPCTSSPLR